MGALLTINGPVVPSDAHNVVLREALFHSPTTRSVNPTSYHTLEVGIREGAYTSWIGTWTQATQRIDAGSPTSILNDGRHGMRLKAGTAIVVRVTAEGVPQTLEGSRINFRMALVGGRDGAAKPLVQAAALTREAHSAVAALEKQINVGGLSEWDEPVQLQDPVPLIVTGTFDGRIQRDSATQISLQRYVGNWIEVDGDALSIGEDGLTRTVTQGLLSAGGTITATAPSSSTLYYVYVGASPGAPEIRLSATAPTSYQGVYYHPGLRKWRFVGWVYVNASGEFADSDRQRYVINYYNRHTLRLFYCPFYNSDGVSSTYSTVSVVWAKADGAVAADLEFIGNNEDASICEMHGHWVHSGGGVNGFGIAYDSATSPTVENTIGASEWVSGMIHPPVKSTVGRHFYNLLAKAAAPTMVMVADKPPGGGDFDPAVTYIVAWVRG